MLIHFIVEFPYPRDAAPVDVHGVIAVDSVRHLFFYGKNIVGISREYQLGIRQHREQLFIAEARQELQHHILRDIICGYTVRIERREFILQIGGSDLAVPDLVLQIFSDRESAVRHVDVCDI